jgi:hypothetical protein
MPPALLLALVLALLVPLVLVLVLLLLLLLLPAPVSPAAQSLSPRSSVTRALPAWEPAPVPRLSALPSLLQPSALVRRASGEQRRPVQRSAPTARLSTIRERWRATPARLRARSRRATPRVRERAQSLLLPSTAPPPLPGHPSSAQALRRLPEVAQSVASPGPMEPSRLAAE